MANTKESSSKKLQPSQKLREKIKINKSKNKVHPITCHEGI
jgi:hypothetical protein